MKACTHTMVVNYPCGHAIKVCQHQHRLSVKTINGQTGTTKKCPGYHTKKQYPIFWCASCKNRQAWNRCNPVLPEPPGTPHVISAAFIQSPTVPSPSE